MATCFGSWDIKLDTSREIKGLVNPFATYFQNLQKCQLLHPKIKTIRGGGGGNDQSTDEGVGIIQRIVLCPLCITTDKTPKVVQNYRG